ncbi:MAG: hypothetical protein AMK70_15410 [Nitrospira bacterium SG8_35_1]|nr:MAG: hypothetical protein AMK70_15410 [Nitrospira bacterium SG8_35_1]
MGWDGKRCKATLRKSYKAAPSGDVTMATREGNRGISFLWSWSKRPSSASLSFRFSKAIRSSPAPRRSIKSIIS